jgi:hypothetical protein
MVRPSQIRSEAYSVLSSRTVPPSWGRVICCRNRGDLPLERRTRKARQLRDRLLEHSWDQIHGQAVDSALRASHVGVDGILAAGMSARGTHSWAWPPRFGGYPSMRNPRSAVPSVGSQTHPVVEQDHQTPCVTGRDAGVARTGRKMFEISRILVCISAVL